MAKNVRDIFLTIDVKRRHILDGEESDGSLCAIALAARESLNCGDDMDINADQDELVLGNHTLAMPKKGAKFISKFDETAKGTPERRRLKPFQLRLKVAICDLLRGG